MQTKDSPREEKKTSHSYFFRVYLERYCRLIFKELIRLQEDLLEDEPDAQLLCPWSFWQFSKLPKPISDALFACFQEDNRWSCPTFIESTSFLCRATQSERLWLLFAILDLDGEGLVTRKEMQRTLFLTLGSPLYNTERELVEKQADIYKLVDEFFEGTATEVTREQFMEFYKEGRVAVLDRLWQFLLEKYDIRQQIINFICNRVDLSLESAPDHEIKETLLKQVLQEFGIKASEATHEGVMYRLVDGKGLKAYYYKLVNRVLYMYRNKEDQAPKKAMYVGYGSAIQRIAPKIQTMDDSQIFGFDMMSGYKRRQYYFLEKERMSEWIEALGKMSGVKSDIDKDYWFEKEIGRGKHGSVQKATHRSSGKDYAVKVVKKVLLSIEEKAKLREEIEAQRMGKHACVMGLHQVYEDFEKLYIVEEYFNGRSVNTLVEIKKFIDETLNVKEAAYIVKQVASGLKFLHQFNIVHRDVKAENILVRTKEAKRGGQIVIDILEAKLNDYSLALLGDANEEEGLAIGSFMHTAPEIFEEKCYSEAGDVYALGVVFFELLTGTSPFQNSESGPIAEMATRIPNYTPLYKKRVPRGIIKLIREMLARIPELRPTAEKVVEGLINEERSLVKAGKRGSLK